MLIMLMLVLMILVAVDECDASTLYDIIMIIILGIFACSYMGSTVILTKLVEEDTRGTILTLMGFVGGVANLIFIPLNKTMYQ